MTLWIWAAILQLLILVLIAVGPYIGLYGREDQRASDRETLKR
jgi:uncharacterized membrane protein